MGARRVGAPRVGAKISRFFFPLPPQNSFFSSFSGCLLVEFWWCLKRRGAHLSALAFKNTTKIQREDTQRGKKRTNFAAGEGKKKERNFGRSRGRSVPGRTVAGRAVQTKP